MAKKATIQKEIHLSGIGIHSGENVDLFLKPSTSGEVILRRKDLGNEEIKIDFQNIKTKRSSFLETNVGRVLTLEHLLAVLYIFGVDSVVIELSGVEVPIMDGSARPFVQAVEEVGISLLSERKKSIRILKPYRLEEDDAYISFCPDSLFKITYSIEYGHPVIKRQELSLALSVENFIKEIAPARTFGFLKEVPYLLSQGLAHGGSLENAIVLDDTRVISGSLRFPDEFVRHKILDLIGDLSLLGYSVLGHFKAHKAGHSLHIEAIRFLLGNPEFWDYV